MSILLLLAVAQLPDDLQRHRNLGTARYERGEYTLAVSELEKAVRFEGASARDFFNLGMAYLQDGQDDRALAAFTTAKQMEPALIEADFGLGVLHKRSQRYPLAIELFDKVAVRDPEDPCTWLQIGAVAAAMQRTDEAQRAFQRILALGYPSARNFYVSALFRYATLLARRGEREEAQKLFGEFQKLREATPNVALSETALENGRYARVEPPPNPAPPPSAAASPTGTESERVVLETGCERGVGVALGDFDSDGQADLFVAVPCGGNRLLRSLGGDAFEDVTQAAGLGGSPPARGALFINEENSGAPSLYVWGEGKQRLYRNQDGRFEDASAASGLPADPGPTAAAALDFDNDGQLDLVLAGPGNGLEVWRNRGDGTFETRIGIPLPGPPRELAAADFNEDGFSDLITRLGSGQALWFENLAGAFRASPETIGRGDRIAVLDFDRDGWLDVLVGNEAYSNRRGRFQRVGETGRKDEGLSERLWAGEDGTVRISRSARGPVLRLALEGKRTNRQALGAVVELKAGRFYRKVIYPGHPIALSTEGRERLDVVRVTWTNGIVQNLLDVRAGTLEIEEEERQASSCPFLYVWDGRRFRFLTDVLGRAPLGEVLPDGSLLTPNPEDTVRIPPDVMAEKDGELVFQITEELREQAYVDSIELLAVDHPSTVEIYADERFSSPPFGPFRWYAASPGEPPLQAMNHRGQDVLDRLKDADGEYVSEFARDRVPGFAEEHAVVLTPPPAQPAEPLWLLLSGWVYWPGSSSMKALSSNGRLSPRPPRLEAKGPAGEWVMAIEDLGLPSGIDRTLVVDLTGALPSSDRRIRISTNFAVHWDRAAFARPSSESGVLTRSIAPASADLHYRGFSEVDVEEGKPERYDYENLLPHAPWNAASGRYTRYGDVDSLLSSPDGRLVVMAPGDEMTIRFDPAALPPPAPGGERSYFLRLTGWAKDQDPNTRDSGSVEPLPGEAQQDVFRTRTVPALIPPLALPEPVGGGESPSLLDALTKGTPSAALRYRYEIVDDDGFREKAHASTLRTAFGYRTLPYRNVSFFLEAQNVAAIGEDRFDNRGAGHLANGVSNRPGVADPSQTRLQQAYGRFEAFDTGFDVGRREIAYGDHRFVGDVSFRQNHQTFDAVHLSSRLLPKTTLSYAFAGKVVRIDGAGKDMSSHFLNARIALDPRVSLELFGYLLDYEAPADALLSSQSYGGKLSGSRTLTGAGRLLFEIQYAKQTSFGANPANLDADYLHLVGGIGLSENASFRIGRELLGGSAGKGAFQTPLATLFKFNGWADKFLVTPPHGLVDWYASGEGRIGPLSWIAAYHEFGADEGGAPYGSELDFRTVLTTSWKQAFGFQAALYREDGFASDTSKAWAWTEWGF